MKNNLEIVIKLPKGIGYDKAQRKLSMDLEMAKEIFAELGHHIRWETDRKGGRPLSDQPRCPCGEMTLKRAQARAHYCDKDGPVKPLRPNKRGIYPR